MTATLSFNLDDFDDRMAHLRCVKALDMALLLFEIEQLIFSCRTSDEQIDLIKKAMKDIQLDNLIQ